MRLASALAFSSRGHAPGQRDSARGHMPTSPLLLYVMVREGLHKPSVCHSRAQGSVARGMGQGQPCSVKQETPVPLGRARKGVRVTEAPAGHQAEISTTGSVRAWGYQAWHPKGECRRGPSSHSLSCSVCHVEQGHSEAPGGRLLTPESWANPQGPHSQGSQM